MKSVLQRLRYFGFLALFSTSALLAQRRVAISTVPPSTAMQDSVQSNSANTTSCATQNGVLNSISVPVGKPLILNVYVYQTSQQDQTFGISVTNPSIASAGDPTQGFLGYVTVPAGKQYSQVFTVLGNSVGQTNLVIASTSGYYSASSTPLTAWDFNPGLDAAMKFLDANSPTGTSCRQPDSASLSNDPAVLSTCGNPVRGIVTDGVSQLLMRVQAGLQGTACFTFVSSSPDQGTISAPVISTQAVNGFDYGFSFYQAPNTFGDSGAAGTSSSGDATSVGFYVAYTPGIGNGNTTMIYVPLTVVRPPLMLLHGIWSNPQAWSSFWYRKPASTYFTYAGNYASTHDASFSQNFPSVQTFIANTLALSRAAGYAATQADVVAHSMGGILTRQYINSTKYLRSDNLRKGDIRRLITLDTPSNGSSFANLLINLYSQTPQETVDAVTDLVPQPASIFNGAVCDLAENSTGLQALASNQTPIPAQSFTATGGQLPGTSTAGPNEALFWPGVNIVGYHAKSFEDRLTDSTCNSRSYLHPFDCQSRTYTFDQPTVNDFRFIQDNDTVVALSSQMGGISQGKNYVNLIHFGADKLGSTVHVPGVTNTQQVSNDVFAALDGNVSAFAASLPAVSADGTGNPMTVTGTRNPAYAAAYSKECVITPPPLKPALSSASSLESTSTVKAKAAAIVAVPNAAITYPVSGQVVAPGSILTVQVSLLAPQQLNDFFVDVLGLHKFEGSSYNGANFQVSFQIPDTFTGPLSLVPETVDSSNNLVKGQAVAISVVPSATPSLLATSQSSYFLTTDVGTENIYVTGSYPNSPDLDLTSSVTGTTYTSSDTDVLTVDGEGDVQVHAFGTAVVTVSNSGLRTFAAFTVENPSAPLPAQNLTSVATIRSSGFRLDRASGFFVQTVQVTNTTQVPLVGPLYFAVGSLPSGVRVMNAGTTQTILPVGSSYFSMSLPDGLTLQPGASVSMTLQFLNPSRAAISYTPMIYRTLSRP